MDAQLSRPVALAGVMEGGWVSGKTLLQPLASTRPLESCSTLDRGRGVLGPSSPLGGVVGSVFCTQHVCFFAGQQDLLSGDLTGGTASQQEVSFARRPEQNTLREPSGQMHSAHGIPAASVVAAKIQTCAIQAILTKACMRFYPWYHYLLPALFRQSQLAALAARTNLEHASDSEIRFVNPPCADPLNHSRALKGGLTNRLPVLVTTSMTCRWPVEHPCI